MSTTMSVTRALTKLKTLDRKINEMIVNFQGICVVKGSAGLPFGYTKLEDYEKDIRGKYQSITDLIIFRDKLKAAIVSSNATVTVNIAGKNMTVAEAIEKKTSIQYRASLDAQLRRIFAIANNEFERDERKCQDRLDDLLKQNFGKEAKAKDDEVEAITKPFLDRNKPKLIDPISIQSKIEDLDKEITEFNDEVDVVLSESNAKTMITIEESDPSK